MTSKRKMIIIGAAAAVLIIGGVIALAVRSMTIANQNSSSSESQDDLYISEYGLILGYDHGAGKLQYTIKNDGQYGANVPYVLITNQSLNSTKDGCSDSNVKYADVGRILIESQLPTGEDAPDAYLQSGDSYLVYQYPDDGKNSDPSCDDADRAAKSDTQKLSLYNSFQTLVSQTDDSDQSGTDQ